MRKVVLLLMQKHDRVEKDLRHILSLDPNHADALNALGYTLVTQGKNMDEALTLITKAISIIPDNPAFIDSMGWLHYRKGNIPKAIDWLTKARKLSRDTDIALHLSEALWAAGKKQDAKSLLTEALADNPEHPELINSLKKIHTSNP